MADEDQQELPQESEEPPADAPATEPEAPPEPAPAPEPTAPPADQQPSPEQPLQQSAGRPEQKPVQDPLNTEFLYYSAVLRVLGPTLSQEADRRLLIPWLKAQRKRNRYLAYLTTSFLLDEAIGPFSQVPPDGALLDLHQLEEKKIEAAEWEVDKAWQDTLQGLPEEFQMLECCVHATEEECKTDHKLDKILDQEFQLYLYIARPYAYLIRNGNDRTRVAAWFQMLCSIHGNECCSSMKAIRNDYMMALLGYLQDLRAVGPFADLPSWKTLIPLAEAAKVAAENNPITDPTGIEANEFLLNQPVPEDGAFCYIALTGDLISGNLSEN